MCSVVAIDNPLGCGGIMQTLALGHAREATGKGERDICAVGLVYGQHDAPL